ncbi:unnamed protein product [Polarella glacialis]|uniref:Uncharacterized protein n=1 Tax=Polarella glacialis TaxID=89957 RepID=A0A813H409_POLGL|nr:unnamed protein product [Polarella glacialis]
MFLPKSWQFGLLFLCISHVWAFPSYAFKIPNGHRIPCPPGVNGCISGDPGLGQPASVCMGVGHADCKGGKFPLNPFGDALSAASYQWTKELCQVDSDGDGRTNGEELGDPCCTWKEGAVPSEYTDQISPTHPGYSNHVHADYVTPDCSSTQPCSAPLISQFLPAEEQRTLEVRSLGDSGDGYELPAKETTYVNIGLNIDGIGEGPFHLINGEVLVQHGSPTSPTYPHHFVLMGCQQAFKPEHNGKALDVWFPTEGPRQTLREDPARATCNHILGQWAPGMEVIITMPEAGIPLAGIKSVLMDIHYTNYGLKENVKSTDGMRLFYTPNLRPNNLAFGAFFNGKTDAGFELPPMTSRFFVTRSCTIQTNCGGSAGGGKSAGGKSDGGKKKETLEQWCARECIGGKAGCLEQGGIYCDYCDTCPANSTTNSTDKTTSTTNSTGGKRLAAEATSAPCPVYVAFVNYHAHDIGSEMYTQITRGGTSYNLASMRQWNFNDQINVNLVSKGLTLQDGDVVQTTCVFNTAGTGARPNRTKAVRFGFGSYDEMCLALVGFWPGTSGFICTDSSAPVYTGKLQEREAGLGLGKGLGLEDKATEKWIPAAKGQSPNMCAIFGQANGPCPFAQAWAHTDAGNSPTSFTPSVTSSLNSGVKCASPLTGSASVSNATSHAVGSVRDLAAILGVLMCGWIHSV